MRSPDQRSLKSSRPASPALQFWTYFLLILLAVFSAVSIGINAAAEFPINPITMGFNDTSRAPDPISMALDATKILLCLVTGALAVKRVQSAYAACVTTHWLLFLVDLIVHFVVLSSTYRWSYDRDNRAWAIPLALFYVLLRFVSLVVMSRFGSHLE